ncbi:MAG TPA: insulinase family protein [Leucothrix mucor]|nr:insulinase family protein [Leucothrix mucor]
MIKIKKLPISIGLFVFTLVLNSVVVAGPKIQHWMSDNGLAVYYVHVPELPMMDLRLTFDAGSARDGKKLGVAGMTVAMLDKGTKTLNANQVAEAFESVGANFSAGSARDMAWITLRTLTLKEEQGTALKTWLDVIKNVAFPEKDFERLVKQALVGLEAEKQSPAAIANKAFYKNLYGNHPYAKPQNGTEETVKAMHIEDLKSYYSRYFVAKNGQLSIVGSIDRTQAEVLAKQVASVLSAGAKAAAIPEVKPLEKSEVIRIEFPSSQSHIMIGQPGTKRGDKDYFALYLGNHGLGGSGFTSRLMKEVRVKRGLSYSVYSYFISMREQGPFLLGLQTKNSQVDEAIKVAGDVVKTFQKDGPSEEQLKASKTNITGGFPLRTASNDDIIGYIAMIGFYGLPLNYLDTFTSTIDKISRKEVMDAYTRRLHPDKFLTVIVGKKEAQVKAEEKKDKTMADAKK